MITSLLLAFIVPLCMLLTLYIDTIPLWLSAILTILGVLGFAFANHKENELVDRVIKLEDELEKLKSSKKGGE